MVSWTEKYRPETLDDIVNNDSAVRDLRDWADSWDEHGEAVIIYGIPGIGKTTAAHALANDMGWEPLEMNASDKRTGSMVEQIGGGAASSGTISTGVAGRKLIIIDEADNLAGNADRGGKSAMTSLVKDAAQPIVLIANEYYDMSRGLRNACQEIEFDELSQQDIAKGLRDICESEGIDYTVGALKKIGRQADGDMRSAVNDLQAAVIGDAVSEDTIGTSSRDRSVDIFPYLDSLFKEDAPQEVRQQSRGLDQNPNDLIRWIDENVVKVYDANELAEAYEFLEYADRWLGRVYATQDYTFWRYASNAMTAGVASSRNGKKGGWTRYGPPSYLSQNKTRREVAQKLATESGVSTATAVHGLLPYLSAMTRYCKPKELTIQMAAHYDLDEKQVAHITGSGESTNKVQGIVEEAQRRQEQSGVRESTATGLDDIATDENDETADETDKADDQSADTHTDDNNEDSTDEADDANDNESEDDSNDEQLGLDEFV